METTRKLEVEDVMLLKELQKHLLKRGIKATQKTLLSEAIEFITRKETEFFKFFTEKTAKKEEDSFDVFLRTKYTGGERTNATKEHDLVL